MLWITRFPSACCCRRRARSISASQKLGIVVGRGRRAGDGAGRQVLGFECRCAEEVDQRGAGNSRGSLI
jgi:hypothetical protein